MQGQLNLRDAWLRQIDFTSEQGKTYALNDTVATLVVRNRGWHLPERHVLVDGEPVSGSLFDFCLYMTTSAQIAIDKGFGPYFYLPKMESHLEARLWNDVFVAGQEALGIPRGTVRATCLIETILGAFEMEEILYELREHSSGLNAGRWDYIFSMIKKFRTRDDVQVTAVQLLDAKSTPGQVTEAGVRNNVSVGIQYLESWLRGGGAVAINNLMEDAATAEISRSQLWQWRVHRLPLDDGQPLTPDRYTAIRDAELATLRDSSPDAPWDQAAGLLDELVLSDDFAEFLTLVAYPQLG